MVFVALGIIVKSCLLVPGAAGYDSLVPILAVPDQENYFQMNFEPFDALDETVNVRINSDSSGQIQNEQQICINPTNPDNVVADWRDFRFGYRRVGVGYSFDGGLTWADSILPVTGRPWHSDPGLTHDLNANFYAVVIAFEPDQSASGFEVFKSTDSGVNWSAPVIAVEEGANAFEDKELMVCDRVPDSPYQGNLYIAWTRFQYQPEYSTDVNLIRSVDGNTTWEPRLMVSDTPGLQWPVPVVGAGGVVYVAWISFSYYTIMIDRSFDGGQTWGNDFEVSSVETPSTDINGGILVFSFPAMDADISGGPYHGNLYVAYMDYASYDFDIYFRKSTDQGETWTVPHRLNDDALDNRADQFHPWLTVDENGVITVMFYDRRNDGSRNLRYDIYMTQSFDAGETWTENRRITTVSSTPHGQQDILAGLIGEYSGVAVRNGTANLIWTDFRLGDQDCFGSRVETYTTGVADGKPTVPSKPLLIANYPNPFNGSTAVRFNVPRTADIEISVFDVSGRKVDNLATSRFSAGSHTVIWSPENLSSGIYFVRLKSGDSISARKIAYLK